MKIDIGMIKVSNELDLTEHSRLMKESEEYRDVIRNLSQEIADDIETDLIRQVLISPPHGNLFI